MSQNNIAFQQALCNPPAQSMLFRYNYFRTDPKCRCLCLVEGPCDRNFYSHTTIQILNNPSCRYIWHIGRYAQNPDIDQSVIGKDAVLKAYLDISKDNTLKQDLFHTVFLVDRDYDDQVVSSKIGFLRESTRYITTTHYHSHENYYLLEPNLQAIFNKLGILEKLDDFRKSFNSFCREISKYCALKAAVTACYNHGWEKPPYQCRYKEEEIFDVHFGTDGKYSYRSDLLNKEIALLEKSIRGNKDAEAFYENWFGRISAEPLSIRGHTIFNFLVAYMIEICHVKFGFKEDQEGFYKAIGMLSVPIDLVFGNGKRATSV